MNNGLFGFSSFPTNSEKTNGLLSRVEFDTSGTFVIPEKCNSLLIYALAGGGGGGSGRTHSTGNPASGGSGGGGGYGLYHQFSANACGGPGASLSILIGAGGIGATGVTLSGTNGNDGTNGGATAIILPSGNYLFYASHGTQSFNRNYGLGGLVGGTSTNLAGLNMVMFGSTVTSNYATQGTNGTPNTQTIQSYLLPLMGGAGGGVNSSNVASAGASIVNNSIAFTGSRLMYPQAASAATVLAGGAADSGSPGQSLLVPLMGSLGPGLSGAGGGGGINNNGGNGGNGYRGSGGGGGGGARDGKTSGAGGNGGNGYVYIEAYA